MDKQADLWHDDLTIIAEPTYEMIAHLWASRLSNTSEIPYAFADASPTMDQFIAGLEEGTLRCAFARHQGDPVAASWLHDLESDHDGSVRVGWLGGYVFPQYRGRTGVRASQLMLDHFQDLGVHHIHTAVHIANRKSLIFMRSKSMMRFTQVCRYPDWTTFGGVMADAVIMTRNPTDKMLAWLCASRLAAKRLQVGVSI